MSENFMLSRLQELIGGVSILVALGAAVLAASYVRRSRWAGVLAAGFALGALLQIATRVLIPMLVRKNPSGVAQISKAYFGMSIVGLFAQATLVLGVAGVLSELSRAKRLQAP